MNKNKENKEFYTVRGYELINNNENHLTFAMEDYLEMIYRNILNEGYTRINIIADMLNVQASSTTKMVQKLANLNLVKYEKYGIILPTEKGQEFGEYLLKRHKAIEDFLKIIGVKENVLEETELIEHNISKTTLKKIEALTLFFLDNTRILEEFKNFVEVLELKDL